MTQFSDYLSHGWKLCRVEPGSKGPRDNSWNLEANALKSAEGIVGAGLMHAYSGTCALDIDNLEEATVWLKDKGIDLEALRSRPDSVSILSGRPNRMKLLYRLQSPLPSKSLAGGSFELRSGTTAGKTAQDVLPPTIHPVTNQPYQWKGDWRNLPPIPEALLKLWQDVTQSAAAVKIAKKTEYSGNFKELKDLLDRRTCNIGYDEWNTVGMALHHETGGSDEGLALWDEWSNTGDTYAGLEDLRGHWDSFGRSPTPVTVDHLRRADKLTAGDFQDVTNASNWFEDGADEKPKKPGLQSLSIVELRNRPEPAWIIPGILPEAEFGVIYGKHRAGKTFAACDIALSIALGRPWNGRPVRQGGVYYIAAEDNRGVGMRFGSGLDLSGSQDAPLRTLPVAPRFTDKETQKAVLEELMLYSPLSVVFVDTMASVLPGVDENASKEMTEVIDYCKLISRKTKALVMMVHHEPKTEGRGMRGSSAVPGGADVIWHVGREEGVHALTIEKLKNSQDGDIFPFKLAQSGNSCTVEWEMPDESSG